METKKLVKLWFNLWEQENFMDLPIADDFKHTSPYGTLEGRQTYMELVKTNLDKFLGHRFVIHDEIYEGNRAAVRYTAIKEDFVLEVSEWHYIEEGKIKEIVAYYNIEGEISESRKLEGLDG